MRKNPGRKDARRQSSELNQKGDLNRLTTHKMRTHDGMVHSGYFKKTPNGIVRGE